jgi:hypothetical protein
LKVEKSLQLGKMEYHFGEEPARGRKRGPARTRKALGGGRIYEQSPQEQHQKKLEKALSKLEGDPFKDQHRVKAEEISGMPVFIHLNPELLAAVLYYLVLNPQPQMVDSPPSEDRQPAIDKVLRPFGVEDKDKYLSLVADFYRYLILVQEYLQA